MKRFSSLIFLFLITLASCGGGVTGVSKGSINALLSEERLLSAEERVIATRICYAYQSKDTNFKTSSFLNKVFSFQVVNKPCQKNSANYVINGTLIEGQNDKLMFQTNDPREFESLVQSSSSGYLSQLCGKITTNQSIKNTQLLGNVKIQIEFFKTDLDGYILRYFNPTAGNYLITMAETFKVRTPINLSGNQIKGMDEVYRRETVCSPGVFSDFVQTFMSVN